MGKLEGALLSVAVLSFLVGSWLTVNVNIALWSNVPQLAATSTWAFGLLVVGFVSYVWSLKL